MAATETKINNNPLNILANRFRLLIPTIFFLFGLFYLLYPALSSWFEIFNQEIARKIFLPIDWILFFILLPVLCIIDFVALGLFLLYGRYYLRVIRKQWKPIERKLATIPIVLLPLIWLALTPLGFTYTGRGIGTLPFAGRMRVVWAGGADLVRQDAIHLLETEGSQDIPRSELPVSLYRLGNWVDVDKESQIVVVGIGRLFNMADAFGYIIQADENPNSSPGFLNDPEYFKVWKVGEGVYFWER